MDLSLTPAQETLKNTARGFLAQECPLPRVRELDESDSGFDRVLWEQIAERGWPAMLIPEEYGGAGSSFTDMGVLCEELGRALLPAPFFSTAVLGPLVILEAGTAEQRSRLLPLIGRGELLFAFAYTEPDYGWEPRMVRLQAATQGAGFVLNGTKLFVHDAQVADQIICVARTNSGGGSGDGLTLFLVDRGSPGLSYRTLSGWDGVKVNEVEFESVSVPKANVVGEVDRGWSALAPALDKAAILLSAWMVGGAERAYEFGLEYSQRRVQFGQPIGAFQRVQDHVINAVNALDGSRWTTYEALSKLDAGEPVEIAASVAKAAASDGYHTVCHHSHEIHGGIGTSKEYGLYLYTKASRTLFHYLGDPTYHRRRLSRLLAR